jgi:excisionase family DNA binding protein
MRRVVEAEQRYTRDEAAALLRLTPRHIDRLMRRGELAPVERLGRAVRVPASTIERFCQARRLSFLPSGVAQHA